MEAHGEWIVIGGAMGALFGIAAGQQQAEIRGLVSVPRKFASGCVSDFAEQNAAQFEAPLCGTVECSGL
jgi:hypothetical protein